MIEETIEEEIESIKFGIKCKKKNQKGGGGG